MSKYMTEEEFYEQADQWLARDISTWNHVTLLAYFCKKYEERYGVRFRMVRSKKGPTMTKEAADFAKLFRTLVPENYGKLPSEEKQEVKSKIMLKIYNYINWMLFYKFRRGSQSVNGTRLFLVPSIIVEFERMYAKYHQKNKIEAKIKELIQWSKEEIEEIFESHQLARMEDLKMIQKYAETYNLSPDTPEERLLSKAKDLGLI